MSNVHSFHVPGEATRREYAVYVIVAQHRVSCDVLFYVGKTGDNREGCNPMISRAGNHLSFNRIHSQSRNFFGSPEEYDFEFFFTTFGHYVPPSRSRDGIELVNEMERQLNQLVQRELGRDNVVNPLMLNGYVPKGQREIRARLDTADRKSQLEQLISAVKEFLKPTSRS